jgi:hypothetical protein
MITSARLVWALGLLNAVVVAAASFLSQPTDLTGRPLLIAIGGVVVSAAISYLIGNRVALAARRELRAEQRAGI